MAYVKCPKGCGKKFISVEHAEKHASADHAELEQPLRKGWATPYGFIFIDFSEPVTYEVACETSRIIGEAAREKLKPVTD